MTGVEGGGASGSERFAGEYFGIIGASRKLHSTVCCALGRAAKGATPVSSTRDEYIPHERTKLDELRGLDRKVKRFPSVFAYTLGCIAALILGTGMCLAMSVIGASMMSPTVLMTVGVIIGCVGIALCIANYFICKAMLKSRKAKYGDKIVTLSNELLNQEG